MSETKASQDSSGNAAHQVRQISNAPNTAESKRAPLPSYSVTPPPLLPQIHRERMNFSGVYTAIRKMTNTSNLHAQDVERKRRELEDQLQAAYDAMRAQGGQVKCDEGQTWRVGEKEGEWKRALEWDGQKQVERGDGEDDDVIEPEDWDADIFTDTGKSPVESPRSESQQTAADSQQTAADSQQTAADSLGAADAVAGLSGEHTDSRTAATGTAVNLPSVHTNPRSVVLTSALVEDKRPRSAVSRIVSQHRSDDSKTVAKQHSSLTDSSSVARTNRRSRPHTAIAGVAASPHSGRISPVDVSPVPHQPFEASFLQPVTPSFSRPATPGGLMPILERTDASFNESSDKAPKTWRVGEGDGEGEVGEGGGEGGGEERARASCHSLPLTADDWDADVFSDTSDESPEGSARSTHEQSVLGSDVHRVYSSRTPRSSVSVRSQSALSTSSSRKGSRPPSAVSKALFRPQSATSSSPAGKPNFDEFFTDKRRIIHERKVENDKKEQAAARVWAEHDRLFNPPLNPVDCLFNKVVENSHPAPRAQSAQSLRSQSARNRLLLSRGLPSVAENAATATLSAATTAPHSGAATSSQSVVDSGMQVRDGTFDRRNRI